MEVLDTRQMRVDTSDLMTANVLNTKTSEVENSISDNSKYILKS